MHCRGVPWESNCSFRVVTGLTGAELVANSSICLANDQLSKVQKEEELTFKVLSQHKTCPSLVDGYSISYEPKCYRYHASWKCEDSDGYFRSNGILQEAEKVGDNWNGSVIRGFCSSMYR